MIKDIIENIANEAIKRTNNQIETFAMMMDIIETLMVSALFTIHVVTGKTKEKVADDIFEELNKRVREKLTEATTKESVLITGKGKSTNTVH